MSRIAVVPILLHNAAWDFGFETQETIAVPFDLSSGITLEYVRDIFADELEFWKSDKGLEDKLEHVSYALVSRSDCPPAELNAPISDQNRILNLAAACLRIIRPTREYVGLIQGESRQDGSIDVRHISWFHDFEVPENQKLFDVRKRDLVLLSDLLPRFIEVYGNDVSKFHMAVQFYNAGHTEAGFWKAKYMLWMCALEALFTSNSREHMGSLVAKARIRWFLGESTALYTDDDLDQQEIKSSKTVSGVLDDLYMVRNLIAHGDQIPSVFISDTFRESRYSRVGSIEGLFESLSKLVRMALLKILRDDLFVHFSNRGEAEAYFIAQGLTLSVLKGKTPRN